MQCNDMEIISHTVLYIQYLYCMILLESEKKHAHTGTKYMLLLKLTIHAFTRF